MAALERPSLAAVLFTDLVESTALRSRLGEERADELRRVHDRLLTERVEAHGGRVLKSTGDGVVAAFGSASDALTAAVESQQGLDRYGRRTDAIAALPVRMGLSVGDVSWEGGDCFGTPLVEAARLQAEAEGGQILCSDFVRTMARGRGGHEFRDLGFLALKGLPDPLATCEVVWSPLVDPELPLPADLATEDLRQFVSRQRELDLAEAVLDDPSRNRAAVLWLLGEPGIGKTRLATEIACRAHAAGALVLFGRCGEDLSVPYQPFIEALRWFLGHVPGDELAGRLGDSPAELARLVPELATRLPGLDVQRATSPEIEQYRLFEAIRSWLAAAGGDRPTVIVLDDVHWADRPTLQLLGHVARSAEPSTAVLACTARNTSPDENESLAALAEELDRRGAPSHRLELGGLDVDEVGELVASAAGRRLDERLRSLAVQLQEETAGNPLFVDALLSSLRSDTAWYAGALPRSVAETVRRRVARLAHDVQDLLRVAAVVGLDFDLRVVAGATGSDDLAAVATLERAAQGGLVQEVGANRYRFAHALVRAALRDELSDSRRVRVHLAVARALEAVHGPEPVDYAGELAHHYYEAVPAGAAAAAYRYTLLWAERATQLLAHDEAADAYGRALELFQALEEEPSVLTRYALLLARGEAQWRASDFAAAQATLREAAEEAASQDDAEAFARAAVAHEDAGWRPGFAGTGSIALLERAKETLPHDDSPLLAVTVASLSRALEFTGRRAAAVERGEQAVAMARRLGDATTTAAVLMRTLFSYTSVKNAPLMAERCAELRAIAHQLGEDEMYMLALNHGLFAAAQMADMATYDDLLDEYPDLVGALRQQFWEHPLLLANHVRAFLAGDLDEAERYLERANEIGQSSHWYPEGVYGVCMFLLRREQGRLGELAPALRALVSMNPTASLWRPGLAALYAELDLTEEARGEFETLAAGDFAGVPEDGNREFSLSLLAEVCCALDDADRAAWLLHWLRPYEGRLLVFWGNYACLGPADRLLGRLAIVCGQTADGERWLGRALELSRQLESPLCTAHCLYDFARVVPGSPSARSMLGEAARLCEQHGLGGLAQRVATVVG